MKRHLFIAAALTGTLALAGCDQADDEQKNAPADTATQTEQTQGADTARNEAQQSKTLGGVLEFVATDTPLPDDARVVVSLRDVARADAPATVITETTVDASGNAPADFGLDYPVDQVDPGHAHVLHAEVRDADGNLLWTSPERHPVEVGPDAEQGPITVTLEPVSAPSALAGQAAEQTGEALDEAGDAVADTTGDAVEAASAGAEATRDAAGDAVDATQEAAGDAAEATEDAADAAAEEMDEMTEDDAASTQ